MSCSFCKNIWFYWNPRTISFFTGCCNEFFVEEASGIIDMPSGDYGEAIPSGDEGSVAIPSGEFGPTMSNSADDLGDSLDKAGSLGLPEFETIIRSYGSNFDSLLIVS